MFGVTHDMKCGGQRPHHSLRLCVFGDQVRSSGLAVNRFTVPFHWPASKFLLYFMGMNILSAYLHTRQMPVEESVGYPGSGVASDREPSVCLGTKPQASNCHVLSVAPAWEFVLCFEAGFHCGLGGPGAHCWPEVCLCTPAVPVAA